MKERILFFRMDHIGDLLLTTSAICSFKKSFPNIHFTIAVGVWSADVLKNNLYIDEQIIVNFQWLSRGDETSYYKLLKKSVHIHKAGFDNVFSFRIAANSPQVKEYTKRENGNIKLNGFVSDERRFFYNGAFLFVFPTIYEGFGIPPLEAMLCGVPVISSVYSSIPEVVDDAGILVATENEVDIKNAIEHVIGNDELRNSLIAKGFEQAKKFSYKRCAEETLEIYNKI